MLTSPLRRSLQALALIAWVIAALASPAPAESTLAVVGPGNVVELSHRLDIRLGPQVFDVDETLVFANQNKGSDAEALYTFDLPAHAGIVGLSVTTASGQRSDFAVVGAQASTRLIADPASTHQADMGLVRMIRSEGTMVTDRNRYELRIFPIPAGRNTTVTLRWHGSVDMIAGNYSIRLPDRGQDPKLARTEIVLTQAETTSKLYGGETLLSERSRPGQKHRFFAPVDGDLVIQGRGAIQGAQKPRAEVALFPLTATTGVAALRILLPDASRTQVPSIDRAILIVDTSASMQAVGLEAAARLVDGLLTELGPGTRVETILFERNARGVLGGLQTAGRDARSKILAALRAAPASNGSNLAAALRAANVLLAADPSADMSKTLIAIVSDGMLPTTLSGDAAADLLGPGTLKKANLLAAVLVPPNAPLPDVQQSELGQMLRRGQGRIVALRHSDADAMSHSLLRELGQPAALDTLEVEYAGGEWVGSDLAGQLLPGSSITALGFYQGKPPRQITVRGLRAGVPETLIASRVGPSQTRALAAIAIANASPFGMPGKDNTAEQSQEALRLAAVKLGVVTQVSAGVAVATGDGYAADRIRSAQRWGMQTYRRVPPPAERVEGGANFEAFSMRTGSSASTLGRTGQLDETMIARRVRAHVIPQARRCYDKLLRQDQSAAGALRLHLEMARGEVLHATIPLLPPSLEPIRQCIEDAMYAMPVPIVRQGQAAEVVSVANYPLRFRMAKKSGHPGSVEPTKLDDPDATDNPLLGLPE